MRSGAHATDAYLADWRRGPPEPCGDDFEQEAATAAVRLDTAYGDARLERLVRADGREEAG